jgi:uroporphyrinogen-III synthase
MKSVLVTGPTGHLEEYAEAARRAGWEARELALLRIEPRVFRRADLSRDRFDWICVASGNALPWLETATARNPSLRAASCAVVGARTADGVRKLGLEVANGPLADAAELHAALRSLAPRNASILCPRGDRSEDLARALREDGFDVESPLAYETRSLKRDGPAPESTAVFFASPSAVRLWHAGQETARRIGIAIGRTTFEALLAETPAAFFDTISLPEPTSEAFATVLAHLDLESIP